MKCSASFDKQIIIICSAMTCITMSSCSSHKEVAPAHPNTLSASEQQDGWRLLFDGQTTAGWRGWRQETAPDGWRAVDGALVRVDRAGDLASTETFDHFELSLEWKIAPGGNSGIFFRSTTDHGGPYETGPEYQILDNQTTKYTADASTPTNIAGANYGLHASDPAAARPAGQWNQARLIVNGDHVEHWLNGRRVVAYELNSEPWKAKVQNSKFRQWPDYGLKTGGLIVLQDHGDEVAFRNIKIRPLPKP